jgi:uncharacterized protein YcfJ
MNKLGLTSAGLAAIMLISGCASTPMGPTVRALPPAGKSFEQFDAENSYCKEYARREVSGQAEAANEKAVGAALLGTAVGAGLGAAAGGGRGAGTGAAVGGTVGTAVGAGSSAQTQHSIQYQYDNAYAQCMVAKGNQLQQPVTVVHPAYTAPAVIYTAPPPPVYTAPPGAVPAPPPQSGYAPPPGAVAPPPNQPAPGH